MPVPTAGNTGYTRPVAKVMISVPDALLARVDARADELGMTRSGFLQDLAEAELDAADKDRHEEFERLLDSLDVDLGGADIAQLIREDRESH